MKTQESNPIEIKASNKSNPLPTPSSLPNSFKKQKQKFICQECLKEYKHQNCLQKHKWEHTLAWQETSKLSISKHQQVQLLEAATVLIDLAKYDVYSENEINVLHQGQSWE